MTKIDLNNLEQEETGSDFHRLETGDTKIRVLTDFVEVKQVWEGVYPNSKPLGMLRKGQTLGSGQSVKTSGWAWTIVRGEKSDTMKIITFPMSIISKLANLKKSDDYAWEDMPMPYDVTIHNTGEGGDRYSITPARQNTELTEEELADLEAKNSIEEIVEKIKDKQSDIEVDYPQDEAKADKF